MNQLYGEIDKLKQGNFQDYETFYNLTSQYIYKIIKDIVVEEGTSAQVMSTTYNQIYQTINTLADNSVFYMWAGQIATDESLKYVNSTGMTSIRFEPAGEFYPYNTMNDDQEAFVPENVLSDMEIQRVIQNTIDGMEVGYKIVMQYFYYEGMSVGEIAARLNIPEEQVKYAVGYIKSTFRNIINSVPYDNNTKMYSLAQIPVFWIVFKNVLDYATMGVVGGVAAGGAAAMAGGNIAGAGAAVGGSASSGAALGGTVSGSGMVAGNGIVSGGGMSATGGITAGGATAGGGAEAGGAVIGGTAGGAVTGGATAGGAAATATAAQTGILATIGGKIALGVAATAILAVGGIAIHNVVTEDDDNGDNDITIEQVSDASDTDATPIDVVEDTEEEITEEVEQNLVYVETEEIYDIDINRTHTTEPDLTTLYAYCDRIYVESTEYPDLANSVNAWSDESYQQYESELPSYIEKAMRTQEDGTYYQVAYIKEYYIERADDSVLSIKCDNAISPGVGSYDLLIEGVTFDTQTGQIITLDELGDIKIDLETYISNYIESTKNIESIDKETISEYIQNDNFSWFLTGEGVYVVINEDNLSIFDRGSFHVVVPYEKLPGMNEKYVLNNNCGLTQYISQKGLVIDIDNDGVTEYTNVTATGYSESSLGNTEMNVIIGDQRFYITGLSTYKTCSAYIYKAADSTRYLILSTVDSANKTKLYLYTYTKTGVEYLHQLDGFEIGYMVGDTLHLTASINLLGSYQAERLCKIENGQFVFVDDRYILDNNQNNPERKSVTTKDVLAVKFEADGYMVDGELASGTVIYPSNTDNATVLGFYLEDGTYGEIYFETTESGVLFEGKTETELFENIIYEE